MSSEPRITRASTRAREESNKHTHATSSYSQVHRKKPVPPKPTSMSVDRLPTFLNEPNISNTSCQTYEPAEPLPLPKKSRTSVIDRCYVLLTPLTKKPSSSGSTSQSHELPVHRNTHIRTSRRQRGEPPSGLNTNVSRADHESDESRADEAHVSSGEDKRRRRPSGNPTRHTGNDVPDPPIAPREVQIAPHPAGFISRVLSLVSYLATSPLAIIGVFVILVWAWDVYHSHSLNQATCTVFCLASA